MSAQKSTIGAGSATQPSPSKHNAAIHTFGGNLEEKAMILNQLNMRLRTCISILWGDGILPVYAEPEGDAPESVGVVNQIQGKIYALDAPLEQLTMLVGALEDNTL